MPAEERVAVAKRFANLTQEGRRAILERLYERGLDFAEIPIIPAERGSAMPPSYAQSRQWFFVQLDRQSTAYHIPIGLRLNGRLDEAALQSSFLLVVNRHEALRTIFRASADGAPEQVIQPQGELKLSVVDLIDLPAQKREAQAREHAYRFQSESFDLTQGPLFRVLLVRLSAQEHVLVLVMHHIISDGWSLQIIVDELVELYRSKMEGREPKLRPLPVQYADFAVWQRHWLEAGRAGAGTCVLAEAFG